MTLAYYIKPLFSYYCIAFYICNTDYYTIITKHIYIFGLRAIIHILLQGLFYSPLMCLKSTDTMANRVDPDQTAPTGAV